MQERAGIEGVLSRVPQNYIHSIVSSWIASRYVYRHGISPSEVSFFLFMKELLGDDELGQKHATPDTAEASDSKRSRTD